VSVSLLMLAVIDFPRLSTGSDDHLVPELAVEHLLAARG